jgi:hypothetical protein
MTAFRRYTAEDDRRILAVTSPAALEKLARELDRSAGALSTRRTALRSGTTSMVMHKPHKVVEEDIGPPKPPRPDVFARPAWFEEDLGLLGIIARR